MRTVVLADENSGAHGAPYQTQASVKVTRTVSPISFATIVRKLSLPTENRDFTHNGFLSI
ncbi:hypothetical protein ACO0LG_05485 [Undibacterium sp. Ji42W]|uniref:hypothetical protein n=1 Tax=Undibacterium sp. Ji42W TaxID=3413039 RepID=UPI003BF0B418